MTNLICDKFTHVDAHRFLKHQRCKRYSSFAKKKKKSENGCGDKNKRNSDDQCLNTTDANSASLILVKYKLQKRSFC